MYLDYRLKRDDETTLFEVFMAENLSFLSAHRYLKERSSYVEKRNDIWGIGKTEDNRTAQQIIEDTFNKHGLKIKRR